MKIKIYQIDHEKDKKRVSYENLENTLKISGRVDPSIYTEMFSGKVDCSCLKDIFSMFNQTHPLTHRGRSLSVSDVVEVEDGPPYLAGKIDYINENGQVCETVEYTDIGKFNADLTNNLTCGRPFDAQSFEGEQKPAVQTGCYFCNSIGFRKIDFDTNLTYKPKDLLHVIMVEPGKKPYKAEIENKLEAMQKTVGGLIEVTYPFYSDNAIVFSNEESKLIGMEGNRKINGELYAGPFFIAGDNGEGETISLTEEQISKYSEQFKTPEQYTTQDVENSIYFEFHSF